MAIPVAHELTEGWVVGFVDECFAQAQTAGDEQSVLFLLDDDVDAADIVGVFDVDFTADEFGSFWEGEGIVVEFAGCGGLDVALAVWGEFGGVDADALLFDGEGDADVVVDNGVGFPFKSAVDVDGC